MQDLYKSTRLGDILVEKGSISRHQLLDAIRLQQQRLLDAQKDVVQSQKYALGELLIELGYISRTQLSAGLSWQKKLRKTTLLVTFVAPLLTAACGGGSSSNANTNAVNASSTNTNVGNTTSGASLAITSSDTSQSSYSSSTPHMSSIRNSAVSSQTTSALSLSARSASASPTHSSLPSATNIVGGPVLINWSPPTTRENGDYLAIEDVGGYELKYKLRSATQFTSIVISNGYTDSYYFNHLEGDYEFQIAAYDVDGLYSDFVPMN